MNDNKNDKNNNVNVNVDIDIKVNVDNKKNSSIKEKKVIKKKGFTVKDVLPDDIISLLDKKFNLDKKRGGHDRKWKYSANGKNRNKFKQNHNGEHKNWKTRSRINSKNNKRAVPDSPADTKTTA